MVDPIMNRIARSDYIALAEMQDRFIDMMYSFDKDFVMHGGTAIWRCYSGNRFSFDIDGYLSSKKEFKLVSNYVTWEMAKRKIRLGNILTMDAGAVFVDIPIEGKLELKAELVPPKYKLNPIRANYERIDGSFFSILTLTPDDFIIEKMNAYQSRRYIRDIFDIYQLVDKVEQMPKLRSKLKNFINNIEKPINEPELKAIILSGVAPTFDDMIKHIGDKLK